MLRAENAAVFKRFPRAIPTLSIACRDMMAAQPLSPGGDSGWSAGSVSTTLALMLCEGE